mmetsp:Transcript_4016/g.10279  ORF Transcript_4016/g.10279 Transcript_4016/m.10279 type:complete len:90 (-) Transcript_4016:15-284(-)
MSPCSQQQHLPQLQYAVVSISRRVAPPGILPQIKPRKGCESKTTKPLGRIAHSKDAGTRGRPPVEGEGGDGEGKRGLSDAPARARRTPL